MNPKLSVWFLLLVFLHVSGCNKPVDSWTIVELNLEMGHDTDMDFRHRYFRAVVLENSAGQTRRLIYIDDLPEGHDLSIGQRYLVKVERPDVYNEQFAGDLLWNVTFKPVSKN